MKMTSIRRFAYLTTLLATTSLVSPVLAQADPDAEEPQAEVDDFQTGLDAYNRGDLPGAMTSFRVAAEAGSEEAQVWLGYILDQSENNEEAVRWYRAAADQGNIDGIVGLAEMYAKGEGVDRDLDKARALFEKAAEAGHAGSIRVLVAAYENGGLGIEADATELAYWKSREAALKNSDK
jgi:TPR repeat protein